MDLVARLFQVERQAAAHLGRQKATRSRKNIKESRIAHASPGLSIIQIEQGEPARRPVDEGGAFMSHEIELRQMTTDALAQKCAQETDSYFNGQASDSAYCFELFRRAISARDNPAWKVLMVQYEPLVAKWVNGWASKHADFPLAIEEKEDFIAEAFARFWKHFTPEKFSKSQSLEAVLKYLKLCVHGAISDSWRKMRHRQFDQQLEDAAEGQEPEPAEPEPTPEDLLQKNEFWQLIRQKSRDEKEYIVIYASFSLALSPREILAEYPGEFHDIKEIYQHKANVLERLERDADIQEFARWR